MNMLFASEVLNGNWAILCIILSIVSITYLVDERKVTDRTGSRAAFSVLVLTIGIGILRISEYLGWHLYRDLYHPNTMPWRYVGGVIGTIGFLLAIREFSRRLYGDFPWAIAVVLMIGFTIIEIIIS